MKTTSRNLAEMDLDDSRTEVLNTDQLVLEAESKRFSRRLKFWEGRCQEIGRD